MNYRPVALPTEQTLDRLQSIAESHPDPSMQLLAETVRHLCISVQSVVDTFVESNILMPGPPGGEKNQPK